MTILQGQPGMHCLPNPTALFEVAAVMSGDYFNHFLFSKIVTTVYITG